MVATYGVCVAGTQKIKIWFGTGVLLTDCPYTMLHARMLIRYGDIYNWISWSLGPEDF